MIARVLLALAVAAAMQAPARAARQPDPVALAARVAAWQLRQLSDPSGVSRVTGETRNPRGWEQAVFWIGMTALADAGAPGAGAEVLAMGRRNGWRPGERPYHADDLAITQAYLWASAHGAGAAARTPTRAAFDRILADPPRVHLSFVQPPAGYNATECLKRWCWCDALFMAPPAMVLLSRQTGDPRYRAYAMAEYWATVDFLYDLAEHLFFRDSRFFDRRDAAGRKLFWSRGNGWVFAGMARTIPLLPRGSADRIRLERLFREMAARLRSLQKPDGYWPPSLLAPEGSPPESSGTAFFTYGLAWGVNAGVLDPSYAPAARAGWAALERAVQPDGRLGWVQQVSDRPEQVAAADTQFYGVGGLLLAASEMKKLK